MLTVKQIAKIQSMTTQAVIVAIHRNRLRAVKIQGRWFISKQNYKEYLKYRFSRKHSVYRGKPLFDPVKGEMSVKQISEKYGLGLNLIYYAVKKGYLPSVRKKCSWVIRESDVEKFIHIRRGKGQNYKKWLPLQEVG